ncbi:MAG: hypothetical protein EOL93_13590 [Epsilonproteobacteria bacterium]|nr:hypothetical protein [Campylobacterota bacterium]
MNIKNLVGKRAIRTKPVVLSYGEDESYRVNPIKILKVTDHHIVAEVLAWSIKKDLLILTSEWIDDNWVDYDELISGLEVE